MNWVCEDPDVIELVNAAEEFMWEMDLLLTAEAEPARDRLVAAMGAIPIPEEES